MEIETQITTILNRLDEIESIIDDDWYCSLKQQLQTLLINFNSLNSRTTAIESDIVLLQNTTDSNSAKINLLISANNTIADKMLTIEQNIISNLLAIQTLANSNEAVTSNTVTVPSIINDAIDNKISITQEELLAVVHQQNNIINELEVNLTDSSIQIYNDIITTVELEFIKILDLEEAFKYNFDSIIWNNLKLGFKEYNCNFVV